MSGDTIEDIYICDCHSLDHVLVVTYDNNFVSSQTFEPLILCPRLATGSFWWRFKKGVSYIIWGETKLLYDDILLSPQTATKLRNTINKYLNYEKKRNGRSP